MRVHARGKLVQRPRDAAEHEDADDQRDGEPGASGDQGALPESALTGLRRDLLLRTTIENDVEIAGWPPIAGTRREHGGAEDSLDARSHGVGAAQRQLRAGKEAADRLEREKDILKKATALLMTDEFARTR